MFRTFVYRCSSSSGEVEDKWILDAVRFGRVFPSSDLGVINSNQILGDLHTLGRLSLSVASSTVCSVQFKTSQRHGQYFDSASVRASRSHLGENTALCCPFIWLWLKNRYPNGLPWVSGNMDQNLRFAPAIVSF